MIQIKRIYDECHHDDGIRILVDRLWPRGISKEKARLDIWLKDIAPSHEIRKWYGHESKRHEAFKKAYRDELTKVTNAVNAVKKVLDLSKQHHITLLYAAKDITYNHAKILLAYLQEQREVSKF